MGHLGGVAATIAGVVLAGLTVVTAVNVSQSDGADGVGQEGLIDYDHQ
jgi:hypothetical protein